MNIKTIAENNKKLSGWQQDNNHNYDDVINHEVYCSVTRRQ